MAPLTLSQWDPVWLERFLAMGLPLWTDGVLPPLWIELLCISGDAAITHMFAHGTQRHIEAALPWAPRASRCWTC